MYPRSSKKKINLEKGFTLIELLVVIAIIAVLLAILILRRYLTGVAQPLALPVAK